MKLPERLLSRMIFAYLPMMMYAPTLEKTGLAALCVAIVFWATVFFFWFCRRFFPERLLKEAFFLWLLAWAQVVWYGIHLEPFWAVSVFFLTPVSFLDPGHKASRVRVFARVLPRYFWERFLAGFGFIGFVIAMTTVQEMMTKRFGVFVFEQPAGMLLLLAAAAFLWKNQNFHRKKIYTGSTTPKKKPLLTAIKQES